MLRPAPVRHGQALPPPELLNRTTKIRNDRGTPVADDEPTEEATDESPEADEEEAEPTEEEEPDPTTVVVSDCEEPEELPERTGRQNRVVAATTD